MCYKIIKEFYLFHKKIPNLSVQVIIIGEKYRGKTQCG